MKHLGDITQIRGSVKDAVSEKKIILDLCGGSGSWSRPYVEGGYDVRNITLPDYDVLTYDPPQKVHGILADPPCTEFSVLNCKAEARARNPEEGLKVVMACLRIIEKCRPEWWAMEKPCWTPTRIHGAVHNDFSAMGVRRPMDQENRTLGNIHTSEKAI